MQTLRPCMDRGTYARKRKTVNDSNPVTAFLLGWILLTGQRPIQTTLGIAVRSELPVLYQIEMCHGSLSIRMMFLATQIPRPRDLAVPDSQQPRHCSLSMLDYNEGAQVETTLLIAQRARAATRQCSR